MNEDTVTLVSTLYALRAGLFAVAIEYDGFNEDCKRAYNNFSGARERAEKLEYRYEVEQEKLKNVQQDVESTQEWLENSRSHHNTLGSIIGGFVLFFTIGAVLLLLCAYCILGLCVYWGAIPDWKSNWFYSLVYTWWPSSDWTIVVAIAVALIALFFGGFFAGFSVWCVYDDSGSYVMQKKDISRAQLANEKARRDFSARKEQLKRTKSALDVAKKSRGIVDYSAFCEDIARKGNVHLVVGNLLYRELLKQFSSLLDERDWGNLDYIIYALETRRAESLKEALQMCDRELQTERLEKSIQSAAQQVSRTIEHGLRDLQDQMDSCFSSLSDHMRSLSNHMSSISNDIQESKGQIISAVSNSVSGVNARLTQIASTSAFNSALLAKANESSAEIARNVSRLRDYADFRYRREVG